MGKKRKPRKRKAKEAKKPLLLTKEIYEGLGFPAKPGGFIKGVAGY